VVDSIRIQMDSVLRKVRHVAHVTKWVTLRQCVDQRANQ
jgi:hypothetical protein